MGHLRQVIDARTPDGKHKRALERRIAHLQRRTEAAAEPLSYDLQELEALRAALVLVDWYRRFRPSKPSTADLLEAAAVMLHEHAARKLPPREPTEEVYALALALDTRARVLRTLE